MRVFCNQFSANVSFLILILNLSVVFTFGQNTQMPDCRHKFASIITNCKISDYTKIIESNPSDAIAYFNRGNTYQREKKYDEAISDFSKVIELDPKFERIYGFRGVVYHLKKEYDLAISDFSRAIELAPKNAEGYVNRGASYSAKNEYDKAFADYDKAIKLDSNRWLFRYFRCWLYYNNGKKSLAEVECKKAKELETLEENKYEVKHIQPTYPKFP